MNFMMKSMLLCCAAGIFTLHGETVFAGSNHFTFPTMTGIQVQSASPKPISFNALRTGGLQGKTIRFSWSFPSRHKNREGMITVYSLLGKVVTRLPVHSRSGSTCWNFSRTYTNSGLYIVRMQYGAESKNLKMMLWN